MKKCLIFFCVLAIQYAFIYKSAYFEVLSESNELEIEKFVELLRQEKKSAEKDAYLGGLFIKKASLEKINKDKMEFFKQGKSLLENAIKTEPQNTEFRFIRLIMQENTPPALKYNKNISEDAAWIKNHYKSTNKQVQKHILAYASQSKTLYISD